MPITKIKYEKYIPKYVLKWPEISFKLPIYESLSISSQTCIFQGRKYI